MARSGRAMPELGSTSASDMASKAKLAVKSRLMSIPAADRRIVLSFDGKGIVLEVFPTPEHAPEVRRLMAGFGRSYGPVRIFVREAS